MNLRLAFVLPCLLAGASAALAADYPPRKPGLWELKTTSVGDTNPSQTVQQCIDARTDQALRDLGQGASKMACAKNDLRNEGGKLVLDSVCNLGPSTATTHAVMTGDLSSAYRMESTSTYKPPFMGKNEGKMTLDAKWIGPCKADQKPGDTVMPGGVKMNILEVMGSLKKK
ncbi:DUF3617 domain-containing protein [Variovorax sp. PAMC 28711]|uniref:DUF3617 domain-containing protein n=1 Tax=Variovorax sp. PAMC 28711 TaxID=1795631 RepID=UPI00078EF1E0|nr:DUF3617 family protein [Variovorax sp. PAMC 28711]AMM24413.1 hypothetical protein AX767_08650 [Variovorax sp. PAMC 28711]